MAVEPERLEGVHWHANGTVTLGNAMLAHLGKLDALFTSWALEEGAADFRFPDLVPIPMMQRIGYLKSFPHLATFVAPYGREALAQVRPVAGAGETELPAHVDAAALEPPACMLAPAACFHAYASTQGADLHAPGMLTMRGTCYRRERAYQPLRRQHAFAMRELVCIGSAQEVQAFLGRIERRIRGLLAALGWSTDWSPATDAFFDPQSDPKYLAQRLGALKTEVRHEGLALCSLNLHGTFFGEAFAIRRAGNVAHSACVAFGLERWLHAFASTSGPDVTSWRVPQLPA